MERYDLAKVIGWAGRLHTRKRLQKVVYMLQSAGCRPLNAEFQLHHYGPYSNELSRLSDDMVQAGLLEERAESNGVGMQYSYTLTDRARSLVGELDATEVGRALTEDLAPYQQLADSLFKADLRELEYASTIVFFRRAGSDWEGAVEKACKFKKADRNSAPMQAARKVAASVIP
jgi:uncharacterized protein YwgA